MPKRTKPVVLLDAFAADYVAYRSDVTATTRAAYRQVHRNLVAFYGPEKPVAGMTVADAKAFRSWLLERLATNTTRKHLSLVSRMFGRAVRQGVLRRNPFTGIQNCGKRQDVGARYFVNQEQTAKVIAACPSDRWRLIVAAVRFAGLKAPSEIVGLARQDVDLPAGWLTVRSINGEREVPISDELRPILAAVLDTMPQGARFLLGHYRDSEVNLRTQLTRILRKADLEPWPRLFVNLRWSRGVEWMEEHGIVNAAAWLGCTPRGVATYYVPQAGHDERRAAQRERVDRILRPSVALVGTGGEL